MSGMDIELCKKIITSARDFGLKEVNLTFQGEPLMFKRTNFIKLVKFIKQNGLKAIVYTNGLLLDRDYSRKIVKAGLDEFRFSVDGITQDVYALNRVGGKYSQVYQNMKDTVQVAQEERSAINIIWQFIAMRNNEHQIDEARSIANKIGIKFEVKTFAASVPELVPKDPKYQRALKPPPCQDIYRQVMVYWNGDVVPCCYDIEGLEIMGNLNDSSLSEIWNGSKFQIFRERLKNVLQNPEGEPELCKGCLKYDSPSKA
jgi:radical SAM protein with 4Fe4S-binding SPASM domain